MMICPRGLSVLTAVLALVLGMAFPVAAQNRQVGIVTGGVSGTYVVFGSNMAKAIDSPTMRVMPMLGKGSRQNIQDLMELDGVDLAIVQTDVMQEIDEERFPDARDSIRYITKLYNEEVHILARAGITDVTQLQGSVIAVGGKGSGTEMTANILFRDLGISFNPINEGGKTALNELLDPNGLLDAMVYVAGKPTTLFRNIPPNSGLNFVSMTYPFDGNRPYFAGSLTNADYPNLVPIGQDVETVSVGALLTVFNWPAGTPQNQAVAAFTQSLFDALPLLKTGAFHEKWKETNLRENVPGWTRAAFAADYISKQN